MTTTANHGCPTQRRLPLPIMCQNINPGPASSNRVPIATTIPPVSRLLPLSQLLRLELTFCLQLPAVDGTLDSPPGVSTTAPNTMARNTGAPPFVDSPPPSRPLGPSSRCRRGPRFQIQPSPPIPSPRTLCRLALTPEHDDPAPRRFQAAASSAGVDPRARHPVCCQHYKPQHRRLALTPALQFDAVEEPPTIGIAMDTIARGSSMCQQGQVGLVFVRKARCGMGETSS